MVAAKMIAWIKNNQNELLVLITILLIATFFRFYQLDAYMTFLGDEGRDALMVKRILTTFDLPLIGPPSSVGNIYLGPLYYYMMSIPMAIFWLNPIAAAGMVATIGVATVGLIYYLTRQWFGVLAAAIASLLYAFSPVAITYSRSSWNPNPVPFFALLMVLAFYQADKSRNLLWLTLAGAALAAAIQMHYLALILLPVAGVFWLRELVSKLHQQPIKHFWRGTLGGMIVFWLLMSPLIIFDLRYRLLNYRALTTLFTQGGIGVEQNLFTLLDRMRSIYQDSLIGRYLTQETWWLTVIISLVVLVPILISAWHNIFLKKKISFAIFALATWLLIGISGLTFYHQAIFDHYLGFLNPVPFILLGSLAWLVQLPTWNVGRWLLTTFLVVLIGVTLNVNLQHNPLTQPPNNQLQRTQEISKFVIAESDGEPFNFALIAEKNYDAAYQFYLGFYGHQPKQVPFEITDQLFVVCEDPVCQPINHPKYEIAAFGWAKIAKEQEFFGVKVFKLVANPSGAP